MKNSQLPNFPDFTNLEPHHQAVINQLTSTHPPYSDYNFVSLWSWDHQNRLKVSILNNNLVIKFQDYTNPSDYFYSFFGTNETDDTAIALLEHSNTENVQELRLIPEVVVQSLGHPENFIVDEDRDSFDYIIATKDTADFLSSPSKRRHLHRFLKKYGDQLKVHELDITASDTSSQILSVFEEWIKAVRSDGHFNEGELAAVKKLMDQHKTIDTSNFHVVGLSLGGNLSAFSIAEILKDGFAMGHYAKALNKHRGIGVALDSFTAKSLLERGVTHFNYEQDMGIEGLRQSKMSKQPVYFLKKYTVSLA